MVPPIQFSGFNYGKFDPALQYVYDPNAGISGCYRAVEISDLSPTASVSTGNSIVTSNGVVLNANINRTSWGIQNIGTGTLYVKFGSGVSPASFSMILKADTGLESGNGGMFVDDSPVYTGIVSVSGAFPRFVYWEFQ